MLHLDVESALIGSTWKLHWYLVKVCREYFNKKHPLLFSSGKWSNYFAQKFL